MHALRRVLGANPHLLDDHAMDVVTITLEDLQLAMSVVKPSAMREVAIDVPKVCVGFVPGKEMVLSYYSDGWCNQKVEVVMFI